MSASAGKVLLMPKGDYDNTATYSVLDWVRYDNKAYVCKQTSVGNLPTNTTYWQLLVQDGVSPTTKMSYFDNGILGAKNLMDIDVETQVHEGITYTVYPDGTINANGTATANGSYLEVYSATLPAGSYTKSGCPGGGSANTYHFAGSNTGDDTGTGATFTLSVDTSCQFVIAIEPGITVTNELFKPMLRLSTDLDDTFRPFAETNRELTVNKVSQTDLTTALATKANLTDLDDYIGPKYCNSSYKVLFDDLDPDCGYKIFAEDLLAGWYDVKKETGTSSTVQNPLIKLTYTVRSIGYSVVDHSSTSVTTGSGGTKFYLRVMK